ncbi:SRPBCC family protein [Sciscionella sediminilitoris]|uniref:SRPBCC family protein n=1 Tax=Sciscionella sediminilitoris TaxID=1445613 RepID=UPI0004DF7FF0|nr:SRPBCC family protein [Sciscionella sp. SE31]
MQIQNEVRLAIPPERLFPLLCEVERIAPCLPGASLDGRDGEAYTGTVRIKVGPIASQYAGKVRFLELDETNRRAVLSARGTEQHGGGNAEAKVVATVTADGEGASVLHLATDLDIRGKVAQFGRGVLGDVSQRLIEQFARNLGERLAGGGLDTAGTDGATDSAQQSAPAVTPPEAGAVDGLGLVLAPLLRRAAPVLAGAVGGFLAGLVLRRRGGREITVKLIIPRDPAGQGG